MLSVCHGLSFASPQIHVLEVLTLSTSECDLLGETVSKEVIDSKGDHCGGPNPTGLGGVSTRSANKHAGPRNRPGEALTPGTCCRGSGDGPRRTCLLVSATRMSSTDGQTHTEPPRAGRSGCFQLEVPACEGLTEAQGRRATGEQKGRVLWRARQATERTRP